MSEVQTAKNALGSGDSRLGYELMSLPTLARQLSRTPAGLRATIHSNTDFGGALRGARVKLGRRVYFRRDLIDRLIVESTGR